MVNDQLDALIREKFQKGERRDAIKASLVEQGWDETDVDNAIKQIQHDALRQMPGISTFIKHMETWEQKTANASPKVIAGVLLACAGVVMVISLILYVWLDPLGTKSSDRDKQRETDFIKLHNSISSYYSAKGMYPSTLKDLLPNYLQSLPLDPKTGAVYVYKSVNGTSDFELCVSFETKSGQCISSGNADENSIPEVIDNSSQSTAPVAPPQMQDISPVPSTGSAQNSL